MKHRIIESADGRYFPQCKPGFLSRWRLYSRTADTTALMLQRCMLTLDPGIAAVFNSEQEAIAFIGRVNARTDAFWDAQRAASQRERNGVRAKRVIKA